MRLLAICRLCPQPCTKMPPPPCELSVMVNPSMLEGLHMKLLGNGLVVSVQWLLERGNLLPSPSTNAGTSCSSCVPAGNAPVSVASLQGLIPWKSRPLPSTVMPAPSSAPISAGSCSSSARLPFCEASQPTAASSGKRSTCGALALALKPNQPEAQLLLQSLGEPVRPRPKRQLTRTRHASSLVSPAG